MASDSFNRLFTVAPDKADMVRDMLNNPEKYATSIKSDFDTAASFERGEELFKKLKAIRLQK